jgi:hypothetical protein
MHMKNRISNQIYVPYGSVTVNNYYYGTPDVSQANVIEDIEPVENTSSVASECHSDIPDSIIFTKKAKQEGKQPHILRSLQKSIDGRRDKTRAFVQELHEWQKEGYVDAHYNARVMYDELDKLMPISFGYDGFKRLYNNSRT